MDFLTIVHVSLFVVSVIVFAMLLYFFLMLRNVKKITKADCPNCPSIIFNRYILWQWCFIFWTILEYVLMLIPIFTSVATIYFTTDLVNESSKTSSAVYLTIMALMSALLPLINAKILPKLHADGFYHGLRILENGILKHNEYLITTAELIAIAEKAEPYTNPRARFDDIGD